MKRITFLLIVLLTVSITAQEAQPTQPEEENKPAQEETKAEETKEEVQPQEEAKKEEAPKPESEKVTMTKEEIQAMVQSMVNDELEKRDAQKKADEKKKTADEKKKTEEEKKAADKQKVRDRDGFIAPTYKKTSLTFVLGDDNIRDNSMYSPGVDIGQRYEYENFGQRIYGYTNNVKSATRFSLFHEESGFIDNLTARISLNFKMYNFMEGVDDTVISSFSEDSSYLEIDYLHPSTNRFKLTFFPYKANKIAIGFFRGLRWGQMNTVYPQATKAAIPGFQALYGYGDLSVYFGFKTHAQPKVDKLGGELVEMENIYGYYGGITYANKKLGLKAHLQGAFVDKGDNVNIPEAILADPDDDRILSYGIDVFAEYTGGSAFGDPLGITNYSDGAWIVPDYTSTMAWRFRAEYMFQDERLQNADYMSIQNEGNIEPITDNFKAHGAMVELGFRYRWLRAMFTYSYRDLPFMVFDAPGVEPFQTISKEADQSPEHTFVLNTDFHIKNFWIGLSYGFKIPATYTVYDANGQKTVTVIKERLSSDAVSTAFDRTREPLPAGESALNIQYIRADLKYRFSDSLSTMLQYTFTQDHNRSLMTEEIGTDGKGTGKLITDWDKEEVKDIHGIMFLVEGRF